MGPPRHSRPFQSLPRTLTPMEVRTLFFAAYRDLAGGPELSMKLPPGATVADLVTSLRERDPSFQALPSEPAVAVNRSYAAADARLSDGDEVAFLPPVAGG